MENPLISQPFVEDFAKRFSWSTNAIEGNTLSLEETERIHPFADGNGRTGRMIINQQLINNGLLPVSIQPTGKYREVFRRYDKREDLSEMVYVLLKSELESFDRVRSLALKLSKDREKQKKEMKDIQNR